MSVFQFLDAHSTDALEAAFPGLDHRYGETPLRPPAKYIRRSLFGFGRDHAGVEAACATPNPFTMMHFAWDYLSVSDRRAVAAASPPLTSYACMRVQATQTEVASARAPRGPASPDDLLRPVDKRRCYKIALALLRFDYCYPRLIRWLGGLYTNQHRDFDAVWDILEYFGDGCGPPPGYPPIDVDACFKMFTLGAPTKHSLQATFDDVWQRERYDNHPPLQDVVDQVEAKFNKEERLSYHVLLPRSVWAFIPGLIISPLNFIQRPGDPEGRICVDPSTKLPMTTNYVESEVVVEQPSAEVPADEPAPVTPEPDPPPDPPPLPPLPSRRPRKKQRRPGPPPQSRPRRSKPQRRQDTVAPNSQTPDTGTPGEEETNPRVYYATALQRFLTWIWRLRMDHPQSEIYLSYDDISAAFHRVLYHPEIAKVYAMVFQEFLVIPVGLIFGAKNSPSLYMIPAEIRAHVAAVFKVFDQLATKLSQTVRLVQAPPPEELRTLIPPAKPDAIHQPLSLAGGDRPPSFVDDTGLAGIKPVIIDIINRSILSAYLMFGFPDESDAPPVINETKFATIVSHILRYLGFLIDSRAMEVEWPLEKREKLAHMIAEMFINRDPTIKLTPSRLSRPLGLIRHGAPVANLGVYHSLRLQHRLNDVLSQFGSGRFAPHRQAQRRWWKHFDTGEPDEELVVELKLLHATLTAPQHRHVWRRPIGLIVKRMWDFHLEGDASYQGLGGFCPELNFMWRLSRADMVTVGFAMYELGPQHEEKGTHVNILEFIVQIINLWLGLSLARPGSQPVILATGDSTSALSWMWFATRAKNPVVRRLARFLQALLTFYPHHFALQKEHWKGETNVTTDVLSRFKIAPTWQSAIEVTSPTLDTCRPYRVPFALATALQKVATSEQAAEWYVTQTTAMWTIVPSTLPNGWRQSRTMTSL